MANTLNSSSAPSVQTLQESIQRHVRYSLGREWSQLSGAELFRAVALTVRDRLMEQLLATEARYQQAQAKRLYYLSIEFLMGRSLHNNLSNLGLLELCQEALRGLGTDLTTLEDYEQDAALGNGGLGRLAACFLDSLATLDMPGYGYGIHYAYGLFQQEISNGYQRERPDNWLAYGTPWEIERIEEACLIPVYGRIEHAIDRDGYYNPMWMDWHILVGVPHDMPIVGYGGCTVNYLRLYSARSSAEFDMQIFNAGDYLRAVEQKIASETVTKVLYPSDAVESGQELRLLQEYFLVACAIRDIMRRYLRTHTTFTTFASQVAIQLNDTHPAIAVAELMRMLIDENDLPWEQAWELTQATLGYTNHTLLPEALEMWSAALFERVLPRHLQIIVEINRRFLEHVVQVWPGDYARLQRVSIVTDGEQKQVRMGHLAIVGSHAINGVSAMHTELLKTSLVPDFFQLWPERFHNKTNGITQRRWLLQANPLLAQLLNDTIGPAWITDLDALRGLESVVEDAGFQQAFCRIKHANKARLAGVVQELLRLRVDPQSLFDVQVKRIHEYKRQLLNVLHIIHVYLDLLEAQQAPPVPRTYLFAGKAAPGYWAAKQIIKLIHNVGRVINADPRARGHMQVVFVPDYRVSLAEIMIPAADLSEQISTAGKEASGTGNMKFALNGALTMGTLDGANIEIRDQVGADNIFTFGLQAQEIQDLRAQGTYHPREYYTRYPALKRVMDALYSDLFCRQEPGLCRWVYHALLDQGDPYMHLADMPAYLTTQERAGQAFQDTTGWTRKAILNVARIGTFSSDRTIRQYASDIWHIKSIPA
ncbi:MAG: glycogen/starch/alpha-glucan phosphorylase [Candidatus Tectimicrobiota bacterium]